MTSHSSQGQTADRVLIHVDTELGAKDLLNSRMAYVSVSRGRYDAQIYTNDASTLGQELSRDVSHSPAIQQEPLAHKIERKTRHTNEIGSGFRSWSVMSHSDNDMSPDSQSIAEARSVSRLCDRVARRASPGLDTDLSGLGLSFLYSGNVRCSCNTISTNSSEFGRG